MRPYLIGAGIFLGVLAVFFAFTWLGLGWRYFFAEPRGIVEQEEFVQSGEFRFQAYERFYDLCAQIRAHETRIDREQERLGLVEGVAERNRVLANISGLAGTRAEMVERYNADARKDHTRGQFRAADLPYEIPHAYEGGKTECAR